MPLTFESVRDVVRRDAAAWQPRSGQGSVPEHALGLPPLDVARARLLTVRARPEPSIDIAIRTARIRRNPNQQNAVAAPPAGPPSSVDWRTRNGASVMTAVRDQGTCGSCVAFAATAMLEAMVNIEQRDNPHVSHFTELSEADLFFCGGGLCANGWWPDDAIDRIRAEGVPPEDSFPYPVPAHQVSCTLGPNRALRSVTAAQSVHYFNVDSRKYYLAEVGPMIACFDVYEDFDAYGGGIYTHVTGAYRGGHCVLVVGYDDAGQYWICKNSWGVGWGESGYFRIAYGQCGIDRDSPFLGFNFGSPFWGISQVSVPTALVTSYEQLGANPIASGPAVSSWGSGRLDVFVRGTDSALYQKSFNGSWSDYIRIGTNPIVSEPAAVSWGNGRIDVVVRGTDSRLHHKFFDNGKWSEYQQLGANPVASAPAVCSSGPGRLDVFVRGTDGALHHKVFNGAWSDYQQLGGNPIASDPAAVSGPDGSIDVFVRGTNSVLYHKRFAAGRWSGYQPLGSNPIASAPAACAPAPGRLDVFVQGTDGALYQKSFNGRWSDYVSLGANRVSSRPAAVSWSNGRIEVFVRGTDATLYRRWFDGTWHP